jgi:hypothetical protein
MCLCGGICIIVAAGAFGGAFGAGAAAKELSGGLDGIASDTNGRCQVQCKSGCNACLKHGGAKGGGSNLPDTFGTGIAGRIGEDGRGATAGRDKNSHLLEALWGLCVAPWEQFTRPSRECVCERCEPVGADTACLICRESVQDKPAFRCSQCPFKPIHQTCATPGNDACPQCWAPLTDTHDQAGPWREM